VKQRFIFTAQEIVEPDAFERGLRLIARMAARAYLKDQAFRLSENPETVLGKNAANAVKEENE
jgi:hypothetical protein